MDGHCTHYCPSTIRAAAKHQIILFTLPPNTTHISQPLDKGVFGPLKVNWEQVYHQYLLENPGKVVSRTSALIVGRQGSKLQVFILSIGVSYSLAVFLMIALIMMAYPSYQC